MEKSPGVGIQVLSLTSWDLGFASKPAWTLGLCSFPLNHSGSPSWPWASGSCICVVLSRLQSVSSESLSRLRLLAPGEQRVPVWSLHLQSAAGLLAPSVVGQRQVRARRTPFHPIHKSERCQEDWGKAWQAPNTGQQMQVPTVSIGELVLLTQSDQNKIMKKKKNPHHRFELSTHFLCFHSTPLPFNPSDV